MLTVFPSNKYSSLGNHNLFQLYVSPYVTYQMTTRDLAIIILRIAFWVITIYLRFVLLLMYPMTTSDLTIIVLYISSGFLGNRDLFALCVSPYVT
ncbi:hypothetical protein T4D_4765 [Trichinella pseudospiralis]|uniref:Uncharacterized protein n=1 Tax=Trichinella pseudospiralis TaxID=6337 RepID=A0A0V1FI59_TRIPS|nr:hypothetical protein T4D_4765 [Trichinella pseudospiralis]